MYYQNPYQMNQQPTTLVQPQAKQEQSQLLAQILANQSRQNQQQNNRSSGPNLPTNMMDMFKGGGGSGGGGAESLGGLSALPGSDGGAGSAGGVAGGEGGLGSLGWWGLLAALIGANEDRSRQQGYRDDDHWEWLKDAVGGKVVEQDTHKWADKGGFDGTALDDSLHFGANLATGDFSNAWDTMRNEDPLLKYFRKIF